MKFTELYRIPIAYLLVYIVLILGTGIWIFLLSQGLDTQENIGATLQKVGFAPIEKSVYNFVEVAAPHMFAIGTLIFVVAHFMLFSTRFSQKFSLKISVSLFIVALINICAYLLIIFGFVVSGWIKLLSLALFVLLFLLLLGMVAFSL